MLLWIYKHYAYVKEGLYIIGNNPEKPERIIVLNKSEMVHPGADPGSHKGEGKRGRGAKGGTLPEKRGHTDKKGEHEKWYAKFICSVI